MFKSGPNHLIIYLFLLLFPFCIKAESFPILIKDNTSLFPIPNENLDIYIDSTNSVSFEEIKSSNLNFKKKNLNFLLDPSVTYWIRTKIINTSSIQGDWVIGIPNHTITEADFYIPTSDGDYRKTSTGFHIPLDLIGLKHKVSVAFIGKNINGGICYLRIKNNHKTSFAVFLIPIKQFINISLVDYFLSGIFFGSIIIILVYNFVLFIRIREKIYLYYSIYLFCFGIFAIIDFGYLHYLSPSTAFTWNKNFYTVPFAFMIICLVLYTKSFLFLPTSLPKINRILKILIVARIIIFFLGYYSKINLFYSTYIDNFIVLFLFIIGVMAYQKKLPLAKLFLTSFTLLLIGFSMHTIKVNGIIEGNILIHYGLYIAGMIETLLFSVALADRFRKIKQEKESAQQKIINDLISHKQIQTSLNQDLEERKKELEEKNQELDTLIYKTSHDLKGPLKSIMGLTKIGELETKDPVTLEYFGHIQKSIKRLDDVLSDLLTISKINNSQANLQIINFKVLFETILCSLQYIPGFNEIKINIQVKEERNFFSNEKILQSIFQNLIENAIKYKKKEYAQAYLNIFINIENQKVEIIFEDNGEGIKEENQEKIFDMFYKIKENSDSTGLGLYIVKNSIGKLGGSIRLESKPNIGSSFIINFP